MNILRVILVTALLLSANGSRAQTSSPELLGGLKPVIPTVPVEIHRPPEGPATDHRWRIERSDEDGLPTASFVDSLKGNDAAFHVVVDQGKLLTVKQPIASAEGRAAIAVGDPSIVEFEVMPDPRMVRLIGLRAGTSDLSITTADGQVYNFEIHVGWDLDLLRAQLNPSVAKNSRRFSEWWEFLER
jgi:Flp pilus assembly secretin CpaC